MKLDEVIVSRAILERFARKFSQYLDVAVVGVGPSGLVAAYLWPLYFSGHFAR